MSLAVAVEVAPNVTSAKDDADDVAADDIRAHDVAADDVVADDDNKDGSAIVSAFDAS